MIGCPCHAIRLLGLNCRTRTSEHTCPPVPITARVHSTPQRPFPTTSNRSMRPNVSDPPALGLEARHRTLSNNTFSLQATWPGYVRTPAVDDVALDAHLLRGERASFCG
eukprot:5114756-Pyramimonas_sp.AAC.1